MSTTPAGPSRIGQISIPVKEVERAVGFYRDALGLTLLFEVPGMAFFDCGGVRLMLSRAESAEFDHPASVLYYRVADIGAARGRMAQREVEFRDEPHKVAELPDHELWMTFFDDTEGNVGALMEERRR